MKTDNVVGEYFTYTNINRNGGRRDTTHNSIARSTKFKSEQETAMAPTVLGGRESWTLDSPQVPPSKGKTTPQYTGY